MGRMSTRRALTLALVTALLAPGAEAGKEPPPKNLPLQEDLVLGLDPEVPLGNVADVAVDSQGTIYVLDRGFNTVHKFTADGAFVADLGREGEGPGEFFRPSCLAVGPEGRVFVAPLTGPVVILNPDGTPAGTIPRTRHSPARSIRVDAAGNVYVVAVDTVDHTMIHKYSAGTYHDTVSFGASYVVGTDADPRGEVSYAGGFIDFGADGLLYYVQWAPQIVRIYTVEGELKTTLKARFDESPVPEPEIHGDSVVFRTPPASTPILCLPGGRFLAGQGRFEEEGGYRVTVDLYDASGKRLFSHEAPRVFRPAAKDREDRIYVVEERDDVPVVVRYRLDLPRPTR